jgi:drug/metabolite transporter (DMT)-like permease
MMKGIHYSIGPFYYGLLGTGVALVFIIQESATTVGVPNRLGMNDLILFSLIGLTSAFGAVFKSLAFHYEKVSTLSLIKYSSLIYSFLADLIIFHSHIYMGEIIGASIILSANIFIAIMKMYQKAE